MTLLGFLNVHKLATLVFGHPIVLFSSIFNDDEEGGGKVIGPLTPYLSEKYPIYLVVVVCRRRRKFTFAICGQKFLTFIFGLEGGAHTELG